MSSTTHLMDIDNPTPRKMTADNRDYQQWLQYAFEVFVIGWEIRHHTCHDLHKIGKGTAANHTSCMGADFELEGKPMPKKGYKRQMLKFKDSLSTAATERAKRVFDERVKLANRAETQKARGSPQQGN